jgi:hypothetical protein
MSRTLLGRAASALCIGLVACQSTTPVPLSGMGADIDYLASRALGGRETATSGNETAARFLVRRYEQIGLPGPFVESCGGHSSCERAYSQFFVSRRGRGHNVGAVIVGADSALRDQYVVVGAHFDHLGRSMEDALDADRSVPLVHPGADDNASGTAGVLELARRFAANPPRRSVLLLNFDAEELGLIGSRAFVVHPPVPLTSMQLMVNLDMIGRLRDDQIIADTWPRDSSVRGIVSDAARDAGLRVDFSSVLDDRSDQASFASEHIPVVALFTGFHADYHTTGDIASRINLPGLERVVNVAEAIVRAAADRPQR